MTSFDLKKWSASEKDLRETIKNLYSVTRSKDYNAAKLERWIWIHKKLKRKKDHPKDERNFIDFYHFARDATSHIYPTWKWTTIRSDNKKIHTIQNTCLDEWIITIICLNHRLGPHQNLASHHLNRENIQSRPFLNLHRCLPRQLREVYHHLCFRYEIFDHRIFVSVCQFLQ